MAPKQDFPVTERVSQFKHGKQRAIEIIELAPEGLGFGEGSISTRKQVKDADFSGLTPEVLRAGAKIIQTGTPFVDVDSDADDDGCGDGRPTTIIYQMVKGVKKTFRKSRRRAKVFGGGLVVASSMHRGAIGGNVKPEETVLGDRVMVADLLDAANIRYGGHTDNHAHGDVCGCGAIDKYPLITANALTFRPDITNVLRVVYGKEFESRQAAIDQAFVSYENQVANADAYFSDAEGAKTQRLLEERGSVIKQLSDDHLEDFIVINDIEGTTFDQRAFDDELKKHGITGTAQVFVVDAWRGRMYADFVADIAEQKGMDRELAFQVAEADFWIRTLAVAGTLTAGDLPVFLRRYR